MDVGVGGIGAVGRLEWVLVTEILPILHPPGQAPRLGWRGRGAAAVLAAGCLALLVVALYVHPNPNGVGTHTQLGQRGCLFLERTGVPCPTCGMTTSFSHFVRGQWLSSLYVQPAAAVLALATALTLWGAIYAVFSGRPVHRLFRFISARYYLLPFLSLLVVAWAWKIFIHLRGIDGW